MVVVVVVVVVCCFGWVFASESFLVFLVFFRYTTKSEIIVVGTFKIV